MQIILMFLILLANSTIAHAQNATNEAVTTNLQLITNQLATVNPSNMNPVDYEDEIENTIYQSGDRLIIIQSIPIKYIKEATEPNIQPTISDYPAF